MAKAINIDYPVVRGNTGFFAQTFDTLAAVKSKIYVLFKTMQSERPFNPDFGLGLYRYVFEQLTEEQQEFLQNEISRQVKKYIPEVTINNLEVNSEFDVNVDQNKLKIKVEFALKRDPNLQDEILMEFE